MARRFTEDEIIARLFAPLAGPAALGLRDDAALLPARENPIVATSDALVAGVHFFESDPPGAIARKALRVNLSDLAAKGAAPIGFLLAIALPRDWTNDWLTAFAAGLGEDARDFGCPLLGGDTVSTPGPLTVSITALGEALGGVFIARTGGRAGDGVYVSGTIGDAALGLRLRRDEAFARRLSAPARDHLLERYLAPRPRVDLAGLLRRHASAAMDVSDGLAGDLAKLARASKLGARARLARVPLSDAAREAIALDPGLLEMALTGGDDYEILCCVGAEAARFEADARALNAPFARIGELIAGEPETSFLDEHGKYISFNVLSFSHF
ncbi:MAG: thiamine-phosphate kinase [Methylocystis sp.]